MPDLIVNADDFGRAVGVNRGVLEAHQRGIVTSTTTMVNFPDAVAGLEMALETAPELGLGVHLNLTSGRPVSPPEKIPALVDENGNFFSKPQLPGAFLQWTVDDLHTELTAQVERFVSLAGRSPTHLDAHDHAAYIHPAALRVMFSLALEYAVPVRNLLPNVESGQLGEALRAQIPGMPTEEADRLAEQLQAIMAEEPRPRWPDRFEMRFFREDATLGELLLVLADLPAEGVTELMCHPRYRDGLDENSYFVASELEALVHPSTRELIATEGVRLMTFADLVG